jgi:hypothetical protein
MEHRDLAPQVGDRGQFLNIFGISGDFRVACKLNRQDWIVSVFPGGLVVAGVFWVWW